MCLIPTVFSTYARSFIILLLFFLAAFSLPAQALTFVVNSTENASFAGDRTDGKCESTLGKDVCTLPAAAEEALFSPGVDTIIISVGGVINGAVITGDIELIGPGWDTLTIKQLKVLMNKNQSLVIRDIKLAGGRGTSGNVLGGCLDIQAKQDNETIDLSSLRFDDCIGYPNAGALAISSSASPSGPVSVSLRDIEVKNSRGNAGAIILGGAMTVSASDLVLSGNTGDTGQGSTVYPQAAAMWITNGARVEIDGLDISGPPAGSGSRGPLLRIENNSSVTLRNARINGGVQDGGVLVKAGSAFHMFGGEIGNNEGGGLYNEGGTVVLEDVWVHGNNRTFQGGAGLNNNAGNLTLRRSLVSGNTAQALLGKAIGGGIYHRSGNLVLENVTVSGNQADIYGGVYAAGPASFTNVTITDNRGGNESGLYVTAAGVPFEITNTVISGNANGDCGHERRAFTFQSLGGNISGDASCPFDPAVDLLNTDPMLGPLADNGGAFPSHMPKPGSPAIDGGVDSLCPQVDQRGVQRPQDGDGDGAPACDSGAVEVELAPSPDIAVTPLDITFPDTTAGTISLPSAVTLTNKGNAVLNVTKIALGNGTAFLLALEDGVLDLGGKPRPVPVFCGNTARALSPGEACFVVVAFQPGEAQSYTDTLRISSDDPDSPLVQVALSGKGVIQSDPGQSGSGQGGSGNPSLRLSGGKGGNGLGASGPVSLLFMLACTLMFRHRCSDILVRHY
ncbi:MAG TPA: right-handed parallel beta-helix repeat-containing protein [Gammaproteobacteria bacterium]|nr:right-handed parallel beta-helix repeat-containing protein [Gammaproteobacteria bacterium]